ASVRENPPSGVKSSFCFPPLYGARIVSLVQHSPGSSVSSSFRRDRSSAQLKEAGSPVADISARYEHFVSTDAASTAEQQQHSTQLSDYGTPATGEAPAKSSASSVIPRSGTISPWASKATDIAHNCGSSAVHRIERGVRYVITPERGSSGAK
ncbi:hypothetical protein OY671_012230, partial [Metschnikowia pulcherrima]